MQAVKKSGPEWSAVSYLSPRGKLGNWLHAVQHPHPSLLQGFSYCPRASAWYPCLGSKITALLVQSTQSLFSNDICVQKRF